MYVTFVCPGVKEWGMILVDALPKYGDKVMFGDLESFVVTDVEHHVLEKTVAKVRIVLAKIADCEPDLDMGTERIKL